MKQPIYEVYTGALDDILFPPAGQPRGFVFCDLYTFELATGQVLRYTNADVDIAYGGNTWVHDSVRFDTSASKAVGHWKTGLDVDTWQVVVFPRVRDDLTGVANPDTIGNQPWQAAVRAGALDAAVVLIDRAYLKQWPSLPSPAGVAPAAVLPIQGGRVGEVDPMRTGAVININSHMELLNNQMPLNLFQQGCVHTLFDAGCTLVQSSFEATGTVGAGSTQQSIVTSLADPLGSGTYALGQIVFTTGENAGFAMMVNEWTGGVMSLRAQLPFPVAVGDQFHAYPGCDKTQQTCLLFANLANFGGVPYVPPPETAT